MHKDIGDYALIGDCETAALVSRSGSIDWLCWPRFDSAACLAALLGDERHGYWRIQPCEDATTQRAYAGNTLVLETRFETASGAAKVIDFMPLRKQASDLVRIVVGERGRVAFRSSLSLRFDYGRAAPLVMAAENGLVAIAGPDAVRLEATPPLECEPDRPGEHVFEVGEGERVCFVLTYFPSHLSRPDSVDAESALEETKQFWTDWTGRCRNGSWSEPVRRSLITLKALTYRPTGGLLAAATTSLPERWEGERNWDYRFCWLRDATFTLLTLMDAGFSEEAHAWRDWLLRAVAGEPDKVQPVYGIAGERRLIEWEADWLPGFAGAKPVRIGNAAFSQRQHDIYGEVLDALHQARRLGIEDGEASWGLQRGLLDHLESRWDAPDDGIWEVRSGRQTFTHSRVMAWVAFDRAVKAVESCGLEGPVERWRTLRDRIHAEVCRTAFDGELNAFTRVAGEASLDAALLLMPMVGFLPATDPRMVGTVEAIRSRLTTHGLVLRYDTEKDQDGLPPGEGAFLACSFWLADNLILQGRREEGQALFERLLDLRNDVGLLSEEYDPAKRRLMGNFPQALSHLALVDTAFNLERTRGPARERGEEEES